MPLIQALQAQPMRGCHIGPPWINDITNPREASPTNHTLPHGHHMDWRAHIPSKPPQNTMCTWNRLRGPHISHWEEAQCETWPRRIGRTDLGSADPGLPHGAPLLVLSDVLGCFGASWGSETGCPWPINRRVGAPLETHTSSPSPSFGLVASLFEREELLV